MNKKLRVQIFWFWPPAHLSRINPQDSTKSLPSNANRVGYQPLATDKDLADPNGDVFLQVFCNDHWEIVPETYWKSMHYDMALEILMNGATAMLTPDVVGRALCIGAQHRNNSVFGFEGQVIFVPKFPAAFCQSFAIFSD